MPRNSHSPARSAGFTLIEILVVVVIVALMAATMVLSVAATGRDRELEKESERLSNLLVYCREQAELRTREFGVLFEEGGYQFVIFDVRKGLWAVMETDEALRTRELPFGLTTTLDIEGRPVQLKRPPDSKDLTPQLMLYSNGDITPFAITLHRENSERSVTILSNDKGLIEQQPLQERRT